MSNTDLHIIGELAFQQLLLGHIVLLGPLLALLEESVEVFQGAHKEGNALGNVSRVVFGARKGIYLLSSYNVGAMLISRAIAPSLAR